MNKEEYYNRVKKTRSKLMTDRISADEEYQIICQINYLSNQYIKTLEQALDEIEIKLQNETILIDDEIERLLQIINKAKGE